jgi:hypothetical protein
MLCLIMSFNLQMVNHISLVRIQRKRRRACHATVARVPTVSMKARDGRIQLSERRHSVQQRRDAPETASEPVAATATMGGGGARQDRSEPDQRSGVGPRSGEKWRECRSLRVLVIVGSAEAPRRGKGTERGYTVDLYNSTAAFSLI